MKRVIKIITKDPEGFLDELALRKSEDLEQVSQTVEGIIAQVREQGDRALIELTARFDGITLTQESLRVTGEELERADDLVGTDLKEALNIAYARICDYHRRGLPNSWFVTGKDGEILGQRVAAVEAAGIYVPGGKAAYPSSVLMGVAAARTAGVGRVALVSPPSENGEINPATLFAAQLGGVDEVYRVGGAQAVAALAYGTESIRPVEVIAGPGNIYVTAAKKLVYGKVGIDMLAGPSEIMVIADSSANPAWVAADLLSQAEHDQRAGCLLVTLSRELAEAVARQISVQLDNLPRKDIALESVRNFGGIILTDTLDQAARLADRFAPEHLELQVEDPWALLGKIHHAGAIFIGPYTPEAVGDYWAGPNHVLPTGGSARVFSPLGVEVFLKRSSIISFTRRALEEASGPVTTIARAERLEAHARSVEIRNREDK